MNTSTSYGFASSKFDVLRSAALKMSQEIEVASQPNTEFLDKKGAFGWGTWGYGANNFPWTYDSNESCYFSSGRVAVTPTDGRRAAKFGKGDFVTIPAGMSREWDASEAVQKHYRHF